MGLDIDIFEWLQYRAILVMQDDLWSDEAGFGDSVAATGVTGICGSGIIEVIAELFKRCLRWVSI